MSANAKRFVVGVDLGGTFVRAGLLDARGAQHSNLRLPILADEGPQAGLERIRGVIQAVCSGLGEGRLAAIGIGASGPLDPQKGLIQNPYTLPGWLEVPIVARLQEAFGVPVVLENDADAAALGEYWQGAGQGVDRLSMVTVGTGIGTALLLEGEIYRGLDGAHPEGGHHLLDPAGPQCYCGGRGCWEVLASGSAIARQARLLVREGAAWKGAARKGAARKGAAWKGAAWKGTAWKGAASRLLELAGGDMESIDARLVIQAARQGDSLARQVVDQAASYLALGLVNLVAMLLPQAIVLGGGVMESADLFLPAVHAALQAHSIMQPAGNVSLRLAQLGDRAGLVGAAYAALRRV